MTLNLKYNGRTIINYIAGTVWWLTGFNPYYQNVKANRLSATYTIDFTSGRGMFNAFYKRYKWASGWSFNVRHYVAVFRF